MFKGSWRLQVCRLNAPKISASLPTLLQHGCSISTKYRASKCKDARCAPNAQPEEIMCTRSAGCRVERNYLMVSHGFLSNAVASFTPLPRACALHTSARLQDPIARGRALTPSPSCYWLRKRQGVRSRHVQSNFAP